VAELSTQYFDRLTACLDRFIAAWEDTEADVPAVEDHLPSGDAAERSHALTALIKVDLEYRWARGSHKTMEEYVARWPELAAGGGPPAVLIHEEYRQRRAAGESVPAHELLRRFPGRAKELRNLLDLEGAPTQGADPEAAQEMPGVGEELEDFLLIHELGQGAFAKVFLARQRSMQRTVALKVSTMRGEEAQTLAQLDHPHVVRVFDQRDIVRRDQRLLYMEYVPGGTLEDVVERVENTPAADRTGRLVLDVVDDALQRRGEAVPEDSEFRERLAHATWPEAVCMLGAQVARALDYAHRRRVLHRDVKPANVLLAATGAAKLADFNISYCAALDGSSAAAYLGGSLAYMSPEQLEAASPEHERDPDDLDGRADVYSVGVVLFELLTGALPFEDAPPVPGDWGATITRMLEVRRAGLPPARADLVPANAPRLLRSILVRSLSPNPEERFASAGDQARELELCLLPEAADLLSPPEASHLDWVRSHPILAALIGVTLPNAILAALNVKWNLQVVIDRLGDDGFHALVTIVNGIAFGIGMTILVTWLLPLVRGLRAAGSLSPEARAALRRSALELPQRTLLLVYPLWVIGGLTFPIWLHFKGRADSSAWINFTTSNLLFGVIGATAGFFAMAWIAVRALHPALLASGDGGMDEFQHMRRLSRRTRLWFGVLLAMPYLSLVFVALVLGGGKGGASAFIVLGLAGGLASGLAYRAMHTIRRDLAALQRAMALGPREGPGA
jgi:serine/threonine protein kinase